MCATMNEHAFRSSNYFVISYQRENLHCAHSVIRLNRNEWPWTSNNSIQRGTKDTKGTNVAIGSGNFIEKFYRDVLQGQHEFNLSNYKKNIGDQIKSK